MRCFIISLLLIVVASCKDDDSKPEARVNVTFDGEEFSTSDADSYIEKAPLPSQVEFGWTLTARYNPRFIIHLSVGTQGGSVNAGTFDVQGSLPYSTGRVDYVFNQFGGRYSSAAAPQPVAGKIVITEFDRENKLVSGNFESTIWGIGNIQKFIRGEFSNVPIVGN